MNKANLAFLVIFSLVSSNVLSFVAPNPCGGYQVCTDEQIEIWDGYKNAKTLDLSIVPSVYSGVCYHMSSNYSPLVKHYAVTMIDQLEGDLYSAGRYGFFFEENPYRDHTVESFRNLNGNFYNIRHLVQWDEDGAGLTHLNTL